MNQKLNTVAQRIIKVFLVFALVGVCLPINMFNIEADENEYEIYPVPHSINYQKENYIIRNDINVVFEETIDDATKNRLNEVLSIKNKNMTVSESIVPNKTNILLGVYNSDKYVDQYIKSHYTIDDQLFNHPGSHYVVSDNGVISVLGKDSDAVFYGLTSLKHIFAQMEGSTIRNFTIKDYADTETRGFIEGYYGNPWSYEDRMSLMEFGGDFKMTSYVFAPKNDPYHTRKWRELYPEEEIKLIKKAAAVGNASKCQFVWTAHPFMGGFDSSNVDGEIEALLNKFNQLYGAGVRQFGVLGDDVGSLDRNIVIRVMQAVSSWAIEKGDVYDTLFCPAGYNHNMQSQDIGDNYAELNDYDGAFPEDIQIFWTGEVVRGAVEQKTLDHFRDYNVTDGKRRAPLFWLNWPVNDGTTEQRQSMKMGRADLLKQNVNPEDLMGVVTNPMQEAEASKISLFAIADYSWNVKGFDVNKSWVDSFKYVDEDASESLFTLAKHMTLDSHESSELVPLLNEVKSKLSNGAPLEESGTKLITEMEVIIEACDEFRVLSKNKNLIKELKPFIGSLKDLAQAIKEFTNAANAIDKQDFENGMRYYTNATGFLTASQNHIRESRGELFKVTPAKRQLIPMGNLFNEIISDDINKYVDTDDDNGLVITASSSFDSFHEGRIENIIDGNPDTYAWYGKTEAVGQYYQLNFNEPTTIYGVHIINGAKAGKENDTFGYAKLKYTVDGSNWIDVNDVEYGEYAANVDLEIKLENIVGLRYECSKTSSGRKWPSMREFSVDLKPEEQDDFTMEVIRPGTEERWSYYSGTDANLIDGDENTAVFYRIRPSGENKDSMIPGDYIGVKLSSPIVLGKINILQGKNNTDQDYIHNGTLQYSIDGTTWVDIQTFENERAIDVDLSNLNITAQYVRLLQNKTQKNWLHMREFEVNTKKANDGKVFTNVEEYSNLEANYSKDYNYISPITNIKLDSGQFIGLKLDRIHQIIEITNELSKTGLTIETSKNEYEWEEVEPGKVDVDARYIRIINNNKESINFNVQKFEVRTFEFNGISLYEFSGYNAKVNNELGAFDGDWNTNTHFVGSQYKDSYMTFDLGQTINLNSLKVVSTDSESNFPRHGKFSISVDGEQWTDIMFLGNQDGPNPGEENGSEDIAYVYPENDANYRFKTVEGLNVEARYLKYTVTRDIEKNGVTQYRQLKFYEFIINDGEYISAVNDPTFTSDAGETLDGLYSYMIDGDVSTMFVPNKDNGTLQYSISENNAVNTIKVIQNSNVISNAKVLARVYDKQDDWIELGTLSQVINEFVLPKNTVLLDIKIVWENVIPNIMELLTYNTESSDIDKTVLNELIKNLEDTSLWTNNSKANYENAIKVGKLVLASKYPSQTMINTTVQAIENAINNKMLKGDYKLLEEVIANAETEKALYTSSSWKNYEKVITSAKKALDDKDNLTIEMIENFKDKISKVKEELVYNPSKSEEASLLIEDIDLFIAGILASSYTQNSYQALIDANANLKTLLLQNQQAAINPRIIDEASKNLRDTKDNLVLVLNLPVLIVEFDDTDESLYSKDSFNEYKNIIERGRELLISGSHNEIEKVIKDIETAKSNLKLIYNYDTIIKLLENAKSKNKDLYTEITYSLLEKEIKRVETIDLNKASKEELYTIGNSIQSKINNLVSIEALKAIISQGESFDKNSYVTSTYNSLENVIKEGKALYKAGTAQEINQSIKTIEAAIRGLKVKVDKDEAIKYINSINSIDLSKYTEASGLKYQTAYQTLKNMLNNLDEVSTDDFFNAKKIFEEALDGLELLKVDNGPTIKPNTDNQGNALETGDTIWLTGLIALLCGSLMIIIFAKKRKIEN